MAVSKVILNGTTLIDTTQKTVTSASMLSGTTALKNDGTDITGSITSKSSSDLTVSGATVTAPAGYYASSASKSVASGSATTPATSITANPTISVDSNGLISATVSTTKSITPTVSAGYVSSGTAGTATVSGSATQQLTTQAAQTIHPSTTDQTIASGKYLTGAQTVKGVLLTNLTAANIKKDVVVKVGDSTDDDCVTSVTGTLEGGGGGMSEADLKAFIQGDNTFTDIDWPDGLTKISASRFYALSRFNPPLLPSTVTSIGENAFYRNNEISWTSLPSGITTIGQSAFQQCTKLALTALPSGLTSIASSTFFSCPNLSISSLPDSCTVINSNAFYGCCGIQTISSNAAITRLDANSFNGNSTYPMALTSASFPNLTGINLTTAFGAASAAAACSNLSFVDLGKVSTLSSIAFKYCISLTTMVLRRTDTNVNLQHSNVFDYTPMSGYNGLTGTVYVPSALISTYQTATNWSTLYNNGTVTFTAIEGSDYELD